MRRLRNKSCRKLASEREQVQVEHLSVNLNLTNRNSFTQSSCAVGTRARAGAAARHHRHHRHFRQFLNPCLANYAPKAAGGFVSSPKASFALRAQRQAKQITFSLN